MHFVTICKVSLRCSVKQNGKINTYIQNIVFYEQFEHVEMGMDGIYECISIRAPLAIVYYLLKCICEWRINGGARMHCVYFDRNKNNIGMNSIAVCFFIGSHE